MEMVAVLAPVLLFVFVVLVVFFFITRFLVNVGSDEIAITERQFIGNELTPGRVFALDNEVGLRANYLAPGLHVIPWPLVKLSAKPKFLSIAADELGIIEATGFKNITVQKEKKITVPDAILLEYITPQELAALKESSLGIYSITVYAEKPCCDPNSGCC